MIVRGQKLVLTNVLLFANISDGNDKILRLILGLLIALLGLTVQFITQPFKKSSDDNVYCVVQLMLVLFFALGIMVKLCDTGDSCSEIVGVASAYEVSVVMICGSFLVLAIPMGMFARQLVLAQAVPILRDARTMEPPELLLRKGERYHLFLSHGWSTGQDQCAVIKRQLQLLLPGIVVFLDVDDLQEIGDLEGYVRATGVMLFFLSKKYFGSRNCQKEIKATLELKKPLVLVHEQQEDKGGGSLDVLKAECGGDAMREDIFKERTAIVWHRISHFQNLTLKLIATEMLHHGPTYGSGQEEIRLTFQDELHVSGLALSKPLVIWCSASNPGVAALATELVSSMAIGGQTIRVVYSQDCTLTSLRTLGHTLVHMLLYLNDETWLTQGDVLERDVRAALNAAKHANANAGRLSSFRLGAAEMASGKKSQSKEKIKIILAHENDP